MKKLFIWLAIITSICAIVAVTSVIVTGKVLLMSGIGWPLIAATWCWIALWHLAQNLQD